MGSFERFTTKTHSISLKRQVVLAALVMLVVKLVVAALGAAPGGSWLDLLARLPPSVADLGAALLVFEVLRARRAANRAPRGRPGRRQPGPVRRLRGPRRPLGVAVCLLLLGMYLLVGREAPLAAGIAVGVAARVDPLVLVAAPVALAFVVPGPARRTDAMRARSDRRQLTEGNGGARTRLLHFGGALGAALLAGWAPALG